MCVPKGFIPPMALSTLIYINKSLFISLVASLCTGLSTPDSYKSRRATKFCHNIPASDTKTSSRTETSEMSDEWVPTALQLRVAYESLRGDFSDIVNFCYFFFPYKTSSDTLPLCIYKEDRKILLNYKCT